ncbi:hypothetical protein [uncultured Helicobacter sp.]
MRAWLVLMIANLLQASLQQNNRIQVCEILGRFHTDFNAQML